MARKFHLLKSRVRLGQKAVFFPALFWMIFSVFSVYGLFRYVDLKPKVEENFFFSENDPEFQADKKIAEIFPQPPFVIFAVRGDIRSPDYIQRLRHMTRTIAAMPEVLSVQSLTRGPKDLTDAAKSPLWSRVLLTRDGQASLIPVFMHDLPLTVLVPRIEQIRDQFEAPGFEIMISGAPYITELIQRKLFIDFKTFSLAAFLVFGVVVFAVFRSFRILTGIIITCMNASILTLMVTNFFDIKIGLLTANVSTMVFVITLSTIVFFTFNWRLLYEHSRAHSYPLLLQSMRLTLRGSVWSMLTTFLGFLSLLFVQAEPLRQLGIAGSIGTLMAFISAYGIYPWFLSREDDFHWDRHQGAKQDSPQADELSPLLKKKYTERTLHRKFGWVVAVIGVVTVMSGLGLKKTDTDPSLIAYFREGSEIRKGLEYIDRNGGSSLLNITVKDRSGEKLNSRTAHKKMMALHEALEKGPAVGSVISIAVILSEAARNPLTKIITRERLLKILDSGQYGEVAKFFITKDRQQVLYILRMQEEEQGYPRLENVRRIEEVVRANGFVAGLSGGLYVLQGKLSELLYSSLVFGIILLISLFTVMGWILTRSAQTTLALT
ncbi:MAG TPA: MMPL family transporter, partial [bacterium]|nr:MMPL family transporter [bacterium]